LEIFNKYMIGGYSNGNISLGSVPATVTREDALKIAAMIHAMTCPTDKEWSELLKKAQSKDG